MVFHTFNTKVYSREGRRVSRGMARRVELVFTPTPREHIEGGVEGEGNGTLEQLQLKNNGENELERVEEASNTISSLTLTNRFPPLTITLGGEDVTFTVTEAEFDTNGEPVNEREKV
jgi:hypothetical protein